MCEIGGECQLSEGRKDMALSLVGIEFGRSLRIVATRVQQLNDFRCVLSTSTSKGEKKESEILP